MRSLTEQDTPIGRITDEVAEHPPRNRQRPPKPQGSPELRAYTWNRFARHASHTGLPCRPRGVLRNVTRLAARGVEYVPPRRNPREPSLVEAGRRMNAELAEAKQKQTEAKQTPNAVERKPSAAARAGALFRYVRNLARFWRNWSD